MDRDLEDETEETLLNVLRSLIISKINQLHEDPEYLKQDFFRVKE